MKTIHLLLIFSVAIGAASCSKDPLVHPGSSVQTIAVPNGNFESWNGQLPASWTTNSCPACVPPFEAYIVQQDTAAYQGQFAAKFIYNNYYTAKAENSFSVLSHPEKLKAFVKCNMAANDSVCIRVNVFHNNVQVDQGSWYGTASIANYTQIQIPISQNSAQADSVSISIEGGHVNASPSANTEFWVDAISLD